VLCEPSGGGEQFCNLRSHAETFSFQKVLGKISQKTVNKKPLSSMLSVLKLYSANGGKSVNVEQLVT
jgi:hypothetical protein